MTVNFRWKIIIIRQEKIKKILTVAVELLN
jgi:hypothetical protein